MGAIIAKKKVPGFLHSVSIEHPKAHGHCQHKTQKKPRPQTKVIPHTPDFPVNTWYPKRAFNKNVYANSFYYYFIH